MSVRLNVRLEVQIDPVDPMLFGDNRSARAGEDHALGDQDPSPATLYGAVGGRIAAVLGARGEAGWEPAREVLGAFRAALNGGSPERSELLGYALRGRDGQLWFPRPLTLRVEAVGPRRFALPGLRPAGEEAPDLASVPYARPLATADPAGPEPDKEVEELLLVSEPLLAQLLTGAFPAPRKALDGRVISPLELYQPELRPGLAMDNRTGTAVAGRLFSRPYRRFRTGVDPAGAGFTTAGFTAWYQVLELGGLSPAGLSGVGFLGGDRRRARFAFQHLEGEVLGSLRERVLAAAAEARGFLLYLLTPAVVPAGGLTLLGRPPLAAALGRPGQVSGWTAWARAQQPRPLRTLAPAGSVLFFPWGDGEGTEERRRRLAELWLQPLDEDYRNAGFGRVLPGVWR